MFIRALFALTLIGAVLCCQDARRKCWMCGDLRAKTPSAENSCPDQEYWARELNCQRCLKYLYGEDMESPTAIVRDCYEEETEFYHLEALQRRCRVALTIFDDELSGATSCMAMNCDNTEEFVSAYNWVCVCKEEHFCNNAHPTKYHVGLLLLGIFTYFLRKL